MESFVALDVEISSRTPLRVCAIGAVRVEHAIETGAFSSLVRAAGPVHYTDIHHIRALDLRAAPPWPAVWADVLDLLSGIRTVVAFRASFDRGALLTMCGRHGLRLPRLQFACAAAMIDARWPGHLNLQESLAALGLPFPGIPHDPLADARGAAAIALACAPWPPAATLR
jgi:DNA polymerase III epsilon subunit-like protein